MPSVPTSTGIARAIAALHPQRPHPLGERQAIEAERLGRVGQATQLLAALLDHQIHRAHAPPAGILGLDHHPVARLPHQDASANAPAVAERDLVDRSFERRRFRGGRDGLRLCLRGLCLRGRR